MATPWKTDYVIKNKFSRPGLKLNKVVGVVLHWTATPGATDTNEQAFFDGADGGGSRYASAHIFVDRDSATLMIPLDEVAYHANEKACQVAALKPNANFNTIGVEMCVEKDGTIHKDTIARTVTVVSELCKQFKLNKNQLYRHYDVTGKNCPAPWVEDPAQFTKFKTDVDKVLNPPKPKPKPPAYPGLILKGSKGPAVKLVQTKVGVKADGIFGAATEKAVKDFQKKSKVTADGKVGPTTWAKIFV